MSKSGVLAGGGAVDWFEVQFATGASRQDIMYHPKVTLTGAGAGIVFDVTTDCSGTGISCTDGSAAGLTQTWEQSCRTNPTFDLGRPTRPGYRRRPADGIIYVKVYRNSGTPTLCTQDAFTITASN